MDFASVPEVVLERMRAGGRRKGKKPPRPGAKPPGGACPPCEAAGAPPAVEQRMSEEQEVSGYALGWMFGDMTLEAMAPFPGPPRPFPGPPQRGMKPPRPGMKPPLRGDGPPLPRPMPGRPTARKMPPARKAEGLTRMSPERLVVAIRVREGKHRAEANKHDADLRPIATQIDAGKASGAMIGRLKARRRVLAARGVTGEMRAHRLSVARAFLDERSKHKDERVKKALHDASVRVMTAPVSFQQGDVAVACPGKSPTLRGIDWVLAGSPAGGSSGGGQGGGGDPGAGGSGGGTGGGSGPGAYATAAGGHGMVAYPPPGGPEGIPSHASMVPSYPGDFWPKSATDVMRSGIVAEASDYGAPAWPSSGSAGTDLVPAYVRDGWARVYADVPRAHVVPPVPAGYSRAAPAGERAAAAVQQAAPPPTPTPAVPEGQASQADTGWLGEDMLVEDVAGVFDSVVLAAEADADAGLAEIGLGEFGAAARVVVKIEVPEGKGYHGKLRKHRVRAQHKLTQGLLAIGFGVHGAGKTGLGPDIRKSIAAKLAEGQAKREIEHARASGAKLGDAASMRRKNMLAVEYASVKPVRC